MYGHMHMCIWFKGCTCAYAHEGETADAYIEPFRFTALKSGTAAERCLAVPVQQLESVHKSDAISRPIAGYAA